MRDLLKQTFSTSDVVAACSGFISGMSVTNWRRRGIIAIRPGRSGRESRLHLIELYQVALVAQMARCGMSIGTAGRVIQWLVREELGGGWVGETVERFYENPPAWVRDRDPRRPWFAIAYFLPGLLPADTEPMGVAVVRGPKAVYEAVRAEGASLTINVNLTGILCDTDESLREHLKARSEAQE